MVSLCIGSQIGTCITYLIAAALCTNGFDGGWPSLFYIIGMLGIVWCLAWSFLVYDSPEEHPRISKAEKEYICFSLRGNVSMSLEKRRSTPWKSLLTSTKVWALCVSYFCANWGNYTLLTNIPTYMLDVLYFDIQKNGLTSALPYVGFFIVANISGALYDVVIARKLCSRTVARKIGNTIGLLVPGLVIVGLGFMDCTNPIGAVALLTTSLSMAGFQYGAGFLTYAADIAPQYTGVIFGLANTLATVPGIIAPTVTGYLTTDQLQSQWQLVFFISAGFNALGAAFFIIFGSSEIQEWAAKPYEHIDLMKHSSSSQQANITATCVDRRKDKPESR